MQTQMDPFHVGEEATQSSEGRSDRTTVSAPTRERPREARLPAPLASDPSSPRTLGCSRTCFSVHSVRNKLCVLSRRNYYAPKLAKCVRNKSTRDLSVAGPFKMMH